MLIGGGGVVVKVVVKLSGFIVCFYSVVECFNLGGWKICCREGSEGVWNRMVGLKMWNNLRLFCVVCMIWIVYFNKIYEMCVVW